MPNTKSFQRKSKKRGIHPLIEKQEKRGDVSPLQISKCRKWHMNPVNFMKLGKLRVLGSLAEGKDTRRCESMKKSVNRGSRDMSNWEKKKESWGLKGKKSPECHHYNLLQRRGKKK